MSKINSSGLISETLGALVPRIEDYFSLWSIMPNVARAIEHRVGQIDLVSHVAAQSSQTRHDDDSSYVTEDGIGVIPISGVMQKRASSLYQTASSVLIRQQVRKFANDDNIKGIALHIESPGGQASGIPELSDEINRARGIKPVRSYIEDLGASGAYWAAASADSISANAGAAIGSIGVFMVVQDTSEQAEKLGIKVHVVKAGEMKAAGTWGTEVSQDFLDYLKTEIIDPTYESFISGIMRGRKSTRDSVLSLATGRVWHAERAREMGLIDAVESFESFMESFTKEVVMSASETTTAAGNQPRAATLSELKATFKESSAEWRESQIEAGSTLEQAAVAYGIYCSEQVSAAKRAQAEAEEKAKAAEATKTVDDLGGKARGNFAQTRKQSGRGEAFAKMEEAIAGHMKSGLSRTKAYNLAAEENPELLQQIITEAN